VTLDQLRQRLETDRRVIESQEVYVQADETVPYGEVVRVLALVRQVGIEKMGLVTDPLARE
jgi:biopolymer transport protein TolR